MKLRLAALIPALLTLTLASASEPPPIVKVENPRVRAVPRVSTATAAYMKLTNLTDQPIRLVGGRTEIAGVVEPMITTTSAAGAKGMETVPQLEIPARGTRELKPGGDHLMLMELKSHPVPGKTVKLTLRFEPGPVEITVEAPVFR